MDTATALCFESSHTAAIWSALFPSLAPSFVSIRDLVHQILGKTPADRRAELLGELLTPEEREKSEAYLATMEVLRCSFILTHEDADFCFEALPQTPKHHRLKELLHAYLDSPLAEDWTGHAYELLERLKDGAVTYGGPRRLLFVAAPGTAFLFGELSRAFAASFPDVRVELVDSWGVTLPDFPERPRPLLFLEANERLGIERCAGYAAKIEQRGATAPLCLAFSGNRRARAYLDLCLARNGLPVRSHLETPAAEPTPSLVTRAAVIERLRRRSGIPLQSRLALGDLIWRRAPREGNAERWAGFFAELETEKKIDSSVGEDLKALLDEAQPERASVAPEKTIHLVSWEDFPLFSARGFFGFGDVQLFRSERPQWLLGDQDLLAMEIAGFPVPKPSDARITRERLLRHLAQAGGGTIFTATPRDQYPELPRARWKNLPVSETPAVATPSTTSWTIPDLPARYLSATQLENYAECPTKFFLSSRLRLRRNDKFESQYALLMGQATHLALERLMAKADERAILLSDPVAGKALLDTYFVNAFRETAPFWNESSPLYQAAMEQFDGYSAIIPKLEQQLQEITGGSTPEAFELSFDENFDGHAVKGKIDRIDRQTNGLRLVIDYKTGNVDFTPEHIGRGENFQAYVYWLAAERIYKEPPSGVVFYDLKKGEVRRGIVAEAGTPEEAKKILTRGHRLNPEKLAALMIRGGEAFHGLAARAAAGDFVPAPGPVACERCDFAAICRHSAVFE